MLRRLVDGACDGAVHAVDVHTVKGDGGNVDLRKGGSGGVEYARVALPLCGAGKLIVIQLQRDFVRAADLLTGRGFHHIRREMGRIIRVADRENDLHILFARPGFRCVRSLYKSADGSLSKSLDCGGQLQLILGSGNVLVVSGQIGCFLFYLVDGGVIQRNDLLC